MASRVGYQQIGYMPEMSPEFDAAVTKHPADRAGSARRSGNFSRAFNFLIHSNTFPRGGVGGFYPPILTYGEDIRLTTRQSTGLKLVILLMI